jgi:hypothetical protein
MWTRPCATRYDGGLVAGAYFGSPRTAPRRTFRRRVIHDPRNIDKMDLHQSNRSGPSRTGRAGWSPKTKTDALRKPRSVPACWPSLDASFGTLCRRNARPTMAPRSVERRCLKSWGRAESLCRPVHGAASAGDYRRGRPQEQFPIAGTRGPTARRARSSRGGCSLRRVRWRPPARDFRRRY